MDLQLTGKRALVTGGSRGIGKAVARAAWAFFKTYWLKLGFLCGRTGFLIAAANSQVVFYKYIKLEEANRRTPSSLLPAGRLASAPASRPVALDLPASAAPFPDWPVGSRR